MSDYWRASKHAVLPSYSWEPWHSQQKCSAVGSVSRQHSCFAETSIFSPAHSAQCTSSHNCSDGEQWLPLKLHRWFMVGYYLMGCVRRAVFNSLRTLRLFSESAASSVPCWSDWLIISVEHLTFQLHHYWDLDLQTSFEQFGRCSIQAVCQLLLRTAVPIKLEVNCNE